VRIEYAKTKKNTKNKHYSTLLGADFKIDMNGKRNPWEGVNLLPFIDASRLRAAIAEVSLTQSL